MAKMYRFTSPPLSLTISKRAFAKKAYKAYAKSSFTNMVGESNAYGCYVYKKSLS